MPYEGYPRVRSFLIFLPTRISLSYSWNLGSLLGFIYIRQILRGTFLALFYSTERGFESVQYIMREVSRGWFFRLLHFNGASIFFFFIYMHLAKGLFYIRYRLSWVWWRGSLILILFIAIAFLGYTLVWGQIRFWASVVITSLLSILPLFGSKVILWVWGGYVVSKRTLILFFVLHFLLPYFLGGFILFHLFSLHSSGRRNLLTLHTGLDKVSFFPYYWIKDSLNFLGFFCFFIFFCFFPFILGDPEGFVGADPIVSPVHILPEWYLCAFYGILRAIPNKTLGVLALLMSLLRLFFLPLRKSYLSPLLIFNKRIASFFLRRGLGLRWLGISHAEFPFVGLSLFFSFFYFFFLLKMIIINFILFLIYS